MTTSHVTDLVAEQKQTRAPLRRNTSINTAITEAIETNPRTGNKERDKEFCSYSQFQRLIPKAFASAKEGLTHAQWEYLVVKAHQQIGDQLDKQGHIKREAIFGNAYALAVHQILVAYASNFGRAYALKKLNKYNSNLHQFSEGSVIAAEAALQMVNPRKTQKGSQESLTSSIIRKQGTPQWVTAEIKLRFKNYVYRQFEFYRRRSQINPIDVSSYELLEFEAEEFTEDPHAARFSVYEQEQFATVKNLINRAVADLMDLAKRSEDAGDVKSLPVQSRDALIQYFDPSNRIFIAQGSSFLHQLCYLLAPNGYSRYKCRLVAEYIINHFQKVMGIGIHEKEETTLQPAARGTRHRWNNNQLPEYYGHALRAKLAPFTKRTRRFTSTYVDGDDQTLLNTFLSAGKLYLEQDLLLD